MRRHRMKEESDELRREPQNRHHKSRGDLMHLVNDRVELLQEVFSCMRSSELQAVMPECLQHLPLNNVKELCLEELLGISSKRLTAVMKGEPPPSDTDSSSEDQLRRMSLESISSDEAALNANAESKKKRRKHKESKKRKKKDGSKGRKNQGGRHEAERGGLTVLELLELQARARAIRAQLQAEPALNLPPSETVTHVSDSGNEDDVLIKEEPPEVVELISSDDEKPNVANLEKIIQETAKIVKDEDQATASDIKEKENEKQTVIKRNDLTIIVPKAQSTKKIKLKRDNFVSKPTQSVSTTNASNFATTNITKTSPEESLKQVKDVQKSPSKEKEKAVAKPLEADLMQNEINEKKSHTKKRKKRKSKTVLKNKSEGEASDQDEIMLQLSDSEKMDLLEDFYPKAKESTTGTEDSGSSSSEHETAKSNSPQRIAVEAAEEKTKDMAIKDLTVLEANEKPVENTQDGSITAALKENKDLANNVLVSVNETNPGDEKNAETDIDENTCTAQIDDKPTEEVGSNLKQSSPKINVNANIGDSTISSENLRSCGNSPKSQPTAEGAVVNTYVEQNIKTAINDTKNAVKDYGSEPPKTGIDPIAKESKSVEESSSLAESSTFEINNELAATKEPVKESKKKKKKKDKKAKKNKSKDK